jgi:hypothetical protein
MVACGSRRVRHGASGPRPYRVVGEASCPSLAAARRSSSTSARSSTATFCVTATVSCSAAHSSSATIHVVDHDSSSPSPTPGRGEALLLDLRPQQRRVLCHRNRLLQHSALLLHLLPCHSALLLLPLANARPGFLPRGEGKI